MNTKTILQVLILAFFSTGVALASENPPNNEFLPVYYAHKYLPPHVSEQWKVLFESYQPFWDMPQPSDLKAWEAMDAAKQASFLERDRALPEEFGAKLNAVEMHGVRVVEITPKTVKNDKHALMYMHGGGWYAYSPESTLTDTVPMAQQLGVRIFSVDYKKAPAATIYDIIDQNVAVFRYLVEVLDFSPSRIGVYGCSAGGHLSLAVSNALRNRGYAIPGAAVASSPMVDFTLTNDTWITLEGHDPVISREAYVRKILPILGLRDYRDPVISPQYDPRLHEGIPPTLIQTGGKEVLLSDSLVAFQALESAGQTAKLDIYDGMPHCFPFILPESPEAKAAFAKQAKWFKTHLKLD